MRIACIAVVLCCCQIKAQNTTYFGLFPTLDHSGELSKHFSCNIYLFDAIKHYNSIEKGQPDKARSLYCYAEAGLSYAISKRLSATAAYVYERQNPFRSAYREEHRVFQQLTLKLPLGKATEIKQRLRFDERFIRDRNTGKAPFTHRLRYLLGFRHGFTPKIYGFASTEWFFNTSPNAGFKYNENWSAVQAGFRLNKSNSIEAGLLRVGWINTPAGDWLNQYYLQVTWINNPGLYRHKAK